MSSCCSRRTLLKGAAGAGALLLSPSTIGRALAAAAPVLRVGGPPMVGGLLGLGGSFHDHSTDSDGDAASEVIASYLLDHHDEMGLDFLSFTEHSDLFPASRAGADPWGRSRSVTDRFTGGGFTMLRGFEYTNDQENHLNVIESGNWLGHKDELTMKVFYDWLATQPISDGDGTGLVYGGADGLGQFNHPSSKGPLNWDDYALDTRVAAQMATLEVREGAFGWYWFALSQGWTLGPVMNADYHNWAGNGVLANGSPGDRSTGTRSRYDDLRTIVFATGNSRAEILAGVRERRTTASEQPDLWASLRGPGEAWQGSTVLAEPGQTLELVVDAGTQASALKDVRIVTDGSVEDFALFYRANDSCVPDLTSNDPDFGCNQHTPGYVEQERRFQATGGRATYKGTMDAAPGARTSTPRQLTGQRETVTVPVTVPTRAATRPDGKHFCYALVTRADGARAVTSPLFVASGPPPVVPEVPYAAALPLAALAVGGAAYAATRTRSAPGGSGQAAAEHRNRNGAA